MMNYDPATLDYKSADCSGTSEQGDGFVSFLLMGCSLLKGGVRLAGFIRLTGTLLLLLSLTLACSPGEKLAEEPEEDPDQAEQEPEEPSEKEEEEAGPQLDLVNLVEEMNIRYEEALEALAEEAGHEEEAERFPDYEPPVPFDYYRSRMSDRFASYEQHVPEAYLPENEEDAEDEEQRQSNYGFRIQLISTRDVEEADEVAEEFEEWMRDLEITNYPEVYIEFQQPRYRVQVGDFTERTKAMDYLEFLQNLYPQAWIVHSYINLDQADGDWEKH